MAELISELVSSDELLDWLGAGEESFGIVSALRASGRRKRDGWRQPTRRSARWSICRFMGCGIRI